MAQIDRDGIKWYTLARIDRDGHGLAQMGTDSRKARESTDGHGLGVGQLVIAVGSVDVIE